MFGRHVMPVVSGGAPVFDPAVLNLSGWWRGNYGGAPWAATASAGVSATTGDLVLGAAPDVGAAVNGYTPADFVSVNGDYLDNANDTTSLFTAGAGSILALFYADIAEVHDATDGGRLDPPFYRDSNDDILLSFADNGVSFGAYNSGYKWATRACGTGAWHLAMGRWDSTNFSITLDSLAPVNTAAGALTVWTGTMSVAQNYGNTARFDGKLMELMLSPTAISDADFANIKSYVNSRYALAL